MRFVASVVVLSLDSKSTVCVSYDAALMGVDVVV